MRVKLVEITGKAISGEWGADDESGTGIPVLRTTNFTNEGVVNYNNVVTRQIGKKNLSDKFLRKGDIIIEKSGGSDKQPVGRVVYFDGEENTYLFNNFTGLLRVREPQKWQPKYVFFALYANYIWGGTRAFENRTTGLHNLQTDKYITSVEIEAIPYKMQVEIVQRLETIEKLISLRKRQLEKLDELVKARFVEMFGDPAINSFHWEKVPLLNCINSIENGRSFVCDSTPRFENQPAILKLSAVTYGYYQPDENKAILDKMQFVEKMAVCKGDLLFTRKNTPELVGMCAYVYETPSRLMMPDLIFRLNTTAQCNKIFLWKLINHDLFRDNVKNLATGSAKSMSNISKERLLGLEIILPPLDYQEQFAAFVEQTDRLKLTIQQSLATLELLKQAQMQQYFT